MKIPPHSKWVDGIYSQVRIVCSGLFSDYGLECHEDDFDVLEEGMVGDVFEVDAELVLHDSVAVELLGVGGLLQQLVLVAVADGGHICDAGADVQDVQLLRGVEVYVFADFRPWTDEAHVSFKDVDELRQLVQFVLADVVAGAGYSRIPAAYGYKSFLVRTDAHGAEFQQTEILVVPSHSCLPVEYRTRRVEPDPYCDYQKKRAEQEKSQSACRYIEYPFHFFRLDRISVKLSMTYCTSSSLRWVCRGRVISLRYWS